MWAMIEKLRISLISVMAAVLSIAPRRFEPAKAHAPEKIEGRRGRQPFPPLPAPICWPWRQLGRASASPFVGYRRATTPPVRAQGDIISPLIPTKTEIRVYRGHFVAITICLKFAKWRAHGFHPRPCRPCRVRPTFARAAGPARLRTGPAFCQGAGDRREPLYALRAR